MSERSRDSDLDERELLGEINRKLDTLVNVNRVLIKEDEPAKNEFVSVETVLILTILGIITAIWSDLIMKRLQLKEGKNKWFTPLASIISVLLIYLLLRRINSRRTSE